MRFIAASSLPTSYNFVRKLAECVKIIEFSLVYARKILSIGLHLLCKTLTSVPFLFLNIKIIANDSKGLQVFNEIHYGCVLRLV